MGNVVVPHQQSEGAAIDLGLETGVRAKRLQFRPKKERAIKPAIVKRFDAQAVAHEAQIAFFPVPEREREHPDKAAKAAFDAPLLERGKHHLRIGVPLPCLTGQILAQFFVVIDFSVENHDIAPGRREHGLVAVRREIEDRQSPMG